MNNPTPNVGEIVDRYYQAWGSGDFVGLRQWLADDFTFDGPLMTASNPEEYIERTQANAAMFAGSDYAVVGRVVDGTHAVVLATLTMGPTTLHTAEHFEVRDGKISGVRLYFDPTPLRAAG